MNRSGRAATGSQTPCRNALRSVDGFEGDVALSVFPSGKLSVALRETRVRSLV